MSKIYLCVVLSLLFVSCFESKEKKYIISIDTNRIKTIKLDELFSEIEINPLHTSDSSLISEIIKIIFWKDELYILDRKQKAILIFDVNGRFYRKLRKVGRGPGEYLDIADFTINPYNNNIELVDGQNLYVYDNIGRFINRVKIACEKFIAVNEIEIISNDIIFFLKHDSYNLSALYSRKNKKIIKTIEIYPQWLKEKIPFTVYDKLYRNGNEINYVEGFSNKVYKINENGFILKYEWDFGKYNFEYEKPPLSDLIKSATSEDIMNNHKPYVENYITLFRHNIENSKFILTDFLFKGVPASLLYNKNNGRYLLFNGAFSQNLFNSIVNFLGNEKLTIIIEPKTLKELPKDWFSSTNQKIIDEVNISDNPVILTLSFKNNLLNSIN